MSLSRAGQLFFLVMLMPWMSHAAPAGPGLPADAVSGYFIYAEGHDGASYGGPPASLTYQVHAVSYHGIPAWHISWGSLEMQADHYIRRSDGAPLYVKRVNHALKRTVEIRYSLNADIPHVYRMRSRDEYIERKIRHPGLQDIGALPQMLLGLQTLKAAKEIHFSSINYNDGRVYDLLARRVGYSSVRATGKGIHCAIYEVNLDSWKKAFNTPMRLLIPTEAGYTNFTVYIGPNPDSTGKLLTLRLVGRNMDVASLDRGRLANSGNTTATP